MKERIIFGGMGGCVGYFIATMMKIIAHANVKVRPELANVSWRRCLRDISLIGSSSITQQR